MKVAILSLAAILGASAALATPDKFNITSEEHAACDADAIALCSYTYPDQDQLLACMKAKRRDLSPKCHAVFTSGLKRRGIPL